MLAWICYLLFRRCCFDAAQRQQTSVDPDLRAKRITPYFRLRFRLRLNFRRSETLFSHRILEAGLPLRITALCNHQIHTFLAFRIEIYLDLFLVHSLLFAIGVPSTLTYRGDQNSHSVPLAEGLFDISHT